MAFGPKPVDSLKNAKLDFGKVKPKAKAKTPLKHFAPGELITADRLNTLVDALKDHEARLAKLEAKSTRGTG